MLPNKINIEMNRIIFFFFFSSLLFLASCGNKIDSGKNAKSKLIEFISANKKVAAFGKFDLKGIADKSELEKLPKVGVLLNTFKEIYRYTKIEDSVYFANEIVDSRSVNTYLLIDIANKDSLVEFFKGMGLSFEEKEELSVYSSSQFTMAINEEICVFGTNNLGKNPILETIDVLKEKEVANDNSTISRNILNSNADIVLGVRLASALDGLNDSTYTGIKSKKIFENSFVQSHLYFNEGNVQLKTQNFFSEELIAQSFLKSSDGLWAQQLLKTNTNIAYALNLDFVKLMNFVMKINPSMNEQLSYLQLFNNTSDLQDVFDGRMSYMLSEFPNSENEFGDISIYVGLGKQGQDLIDLYRLFIEENDFKINQLDNGILITSKDHEIESQTSNDKRFKDFGKKGFSFFIDFTKFDKNNLPDDLMRDYLADLNYATFEMDLQGSNLSIYLKESKRNVLSVLSQSFIESFFQNDAPSKYPDMI